MEKFWATIDRHLASAEAIEVYRASGVDALLSDVRALVAAAQNISNTCDFMGRSHITTDKLEALKKAIASVEARMK